MLALFRYHVCEFSSDLIVIIMYIYHALINTLGTHMIHINLNMIFYTHVEHRATKTICIKYYLEKQTHALHTYTHTCMHARTHARTHACTHRMTVAETGY